MMLMRLKHVFVGHRWRIDSAVYNPPNHAMFLASALRTNEERAAWGFTEILERCACGRKRVLRLIGDHSGTKAAAEMAELERLVNR